GAEDVALEAVADVGDRLPLEQRRRPQLLVDEVAHELTHVPVAAGSRTPPVLRPDRHHPLSELLDRPPVHLDRCAHEPDLLRSSVARQPVCQCPRTGTQPGPCPLACGVTCSTALVGLTATAASSSPG